MKIIFTIIILIILHLIIKNYLLDKNSNIQSENENIYPIYIEEDKQILKNIKKKVHFKEENIDIRELAKNNNLQKINLEIDTNLSNKIKNQFDNNNNTNISCNIEKISDTLVKNNLLSFINNSIESKSLYKGFDEIKSKNFSIDKNIEGKEIGEYYESNNNTFNELNDIKDKTNSNFCPPSEKTNIKNIPLTDTACLQGIDENSKWRGKNTLLKNEKIASETVLNGGTMDGGLQAYDYDDGLYSECNF